MAAQLPSDCADDWFARYRPRTISALCGLLIGEVGWHLLVSYIPREWICEVALVMLLTFLATVQLFRPLRFNLKRAAIIGAIAVFIAPFCFSLVQFNIEVYFGILSPSRFTDRSMDHPFSLLMSGVRSGMMAACLIPIAILISTICNNRGHIENPGWWVTNQGSSQNNIP